jgi:hypothetical protein
MAWEREPWFRRARERRRRRRAVAAWVAVLAALALVAAAGIGLSARGPYDGTDGCRELPATRTGYYHPVHGTSRDCGLPVRTRTAE